MSEYTISEFGELPSKGKIYKQTVNPQIHLRSMTTEEEMRRLAYSELPYKPLCDVIDACLIEPIGISAYDLCLGDYQYLLHRLRVVTYGPEYPSASICPICGQVNKQILNLDNVPIIPFNEELYNNALNLDLPSCGKHVKLKYMTPRDVDEIVKEEKDFKAKNPESDININYLLTLRHSIDSVNDQHLDSIKLDIFLRRLNMRDTNLIYQTMNKLEEKVGLDTRISNKCINPKCGAQYATTFRVTNEFFGPTI